MYFLRSDFWHWWELLAAMTEKEIKARYKRAIFGFLWLVLNPVLQMVVIGVIFQFLLKFPINNYYLFLFIGLLVWNYFSTNMNKCTPLFVFERYLLKKASFSRIILPLSVIFSNTFHLIISFVLLVPILIYCGTLSFDHLVFFPLAFGWLLVVVIALSLIFSTLNVRFRDINFFVQAILPLMFYATPIAYSIDLIPEKLAKLIYFNPMTGVIMLTRFSLMKQEVLIVEPLFVGLLVSVLILLVGIYLFRKYNLFFDDWL